MRTRHSVLAKQRQQTAAQQLVEVIDKMPKPRPRPRKTVVQETLDIAKAKEWDRLRPAHFVEMYVLGHKVVYGVEPAELTGTGKGQTNARKGAASAAERMLRQEFGGRQVDMVRFLDWVWKREKDKEKWRRENQREGARLTWQFLLAGRAVLTDYRAAQLRAVPSARAK